MSASWAGITRTRAFGIFLSDRDKFIHRHSFPQPWAAAFVIDPVQDLEGLFLWSNGEPREAAEYWIGSERKLHSPRQIEEGESREPDKAQMPIGSRTTYLLSLTLMLATLVAAGALYYRTELRRARETALIVRGLNSQQQEIDRAQQSVVLLQQYLSLTAQDNTAQKDQVNNSIKQLESGLLLVKTLTRRMQSRIDALENKRTTDASQQSPPEAGSESERKP